MRRGLLQEGRGVRANVLLLALVVAASLVLRSWGLGYPARTIWDEQYYVLDAYAYLGGTPELGEPTDPPKIPNEARWEHPPLAKLLIAAGIGPLGLSPIAWRLPSLTFGVAGVALTYLLALAQWRRSEVAVLAATLVATDGWHIVQSRLAMLDIFATTFVTGALLLAVLDRRTGERRWRVWAGLALGAAIACKWSMAFFVPVVAVMQVTTSIERRASMPRLLGRVFAVAVALPVAAYLAAYAPFWIARGPEMDDFVELHGRMVARVRYGQDETPTRPTGYTAPPGSSRAWQWPLRPTPIVYFVDQGTPEGDRREVVAFGNPALSGSFLVVALVRAWQGVVRRRRVPESLMFASFAAAWLPWTVVGRPTYPYYLVAGVPFMSAAVAHCAVAASPRIRRLVLPFLGSLVLVTTVVLLPLWLGGTSAPGRWLLDALGG